MRQLFRFQNGWYDLILLINVLSSFFFQFARCGPWFHVDSRQTAMWLGRCQNNVAQIICK